MKTLVTDAFDGEHPDDIDAEWEEFYTKTYRESQDRLFAALLRAGRLDDRDV